MFSNKKLVKDFRMTIRVNEYQYKRLQRAAAHLEMSESEFARHAMKVLEAEINNSDSAKELEAR